MKAVTGRTTRRIVTRTCSGMRRLIRAPIEDPMTAAMMDGMASFQLTRPSRMKRTVATVVPQQLESLLVPMA